MTDHIIHVYRSASSSSFHAHWDFELLIAQSVLYTPCGRWSVAFFMNKNTETARRKYPETLNTVRSDAEERMAEERPSWKHKNVPASTKNVMFLWDSDRLPSAMYVVKNVVRTQPEDKNIQLSPWKRAFFGTRSYCIARRVPVACLSHNAGGGQMHLSSY